MIDILREHGWEGLETKVPEGLRSFSPGRGNSAAAAVCDVLDAIGIESPGWSRCGASKARGRFTPAAGPPWGERRRQREARSALDILRQSIRAKAKYLAEHARVGGHKRCGDDFYAALDEHNVLLAEETDAAVSMLAKVYQVKQPLIHIPEGETAEAMCMKLADDTPARRVRLSLARKKYEALRRADDVVSQLAHAECDREAVQSRLRKRVLESQKRVFQSELKRVFQSELER